MCKTFSILAFCNLLGAPPIPPAEGIVHTVTERDPETGRTYLVLELAADSERPDESGRIVAEHIRATLHPRPPETRTIRGHAPRGVYDPDRRTLLLEGGIRVETDAGDAVEGERATVYLDDRRVEVSGRSTLRRPDLTAAGADIRATSELRTIVIEREVEAHLRAPGTEEDTGRLWTPGSAQIAEEEVGGERITVLTVPSRCRMERRTQSGWVRMEADWARVTLQRLPPSDALEPLMLEARGGVRLTDEQGGIASGERMSWSRRDGRAVLEGDPVHVERRTPEGAAQTIACRRAEFDTERGIGRFTGDAIVSVREENRDPVTVRGAEVEAAFRRPPEGAQESEPELEGITVRDPRAAALEMGDRIRVEARQIWISGDQSTARVDGLRSARLRREDGTEYDIIGIGGMRFEGREVVLEGDVGLAGGAETLRARRIRLVLAEDRSLERMHASGDVVFSREGIVARSDELTYDAAAGEAHLRGNPVAVERGGTVMRVEEAWIDLATNAFRGRSTRARSRIVWREGG